MSNPSSPQLVAVLVAMKLRMLANGLRRSVPRTIGMAVGALWALGAVTFAVAGLVALRFQDARLAMDVTVLGFTGLTIAWTLLPLLVFGVDETLDPARFVLLPRRARELLPGLFVAGLTGVPGAATVLVAFASVVTWTRSASTFVAAVLAAVLGVAMCVLLARVLTSAFARVLRSRRFRDVATALLALVAVSFGLGLNIALGSLSGDGQDLGALRARLHDLAALASLVPFGWAWSLPGLVADGRWAAAGVRLAAAAGLVGALAVAWERLLARNLTSPADLGGAGARVRSGGLADRIYPATPTGAIAGRCLRYWRRDPRYLASVAAVVVVPVLFSVSQVVGASGSSTLAAFTPLLVAMIVGTSLSQDTAYDGSALWLHVSTGIAGRADRAGRVLALFTWAVPLQVAILFATLAWTGRWSLWPVVVGTAVSIMCAGSGVASVVSARWLSPAPAAGSNPFASSGGSSAGSLVALAVNGAVTAAVNLPVLALAIGSIWEPWLRWPTLVVGVAVGVIVLRAGVRMGGRRLESRWPEVLAAASGTV